MKRNEIFFVQTKVLIYLYRVYTIMFFYFYQKGLTCTPTKVLTRLSEYVNVEFLLVKLENFKFVLAILTNRNIRGQFH